MALEIERKFLVHKDLLPRLTEGKEIIQGYLSAAPSVRFRIVDQAVMITIKEYSSPGTRFELETPEKKITAEEREKLLRLSISPPIVKTRYNIAENGLLWEIDVYQNENSGLITVDVELPADDYPLIFPAWVDANNEITADERYSNLNLGLNPFTRWKN